MNAPRLHNNRLGGVALRRFTACGALAVTLVAAGLGTAAFAGAKYSAAKVEEALAKGDIDKGIAEGETAAAANMHDGAVRTALGRAYLKAGRFESAASVLADAVTLGQSDTRTVLSLALAEIATGHERSAVARLDQARSALPTADLGLAMALAGEPARGVAILSDALRGGDKSVKLRENLAYAYALDGRWGEARMMVSLDLPADRIDARLTQWAQTAQPDAARERIALLLGVPMRADAGMPAVLALNAAPEAAPVQMAVNDVQPAAASAPVSSAELAPLAAAPAAAPAPADQPAPVQAMASQPEAAPMPAMAEAKVPTFLAVEPTDQDKHLAVSAPTKWAASAPKADAVSLGGDHVVQLGAFLHEANAISAKRKFAARNHAFAGHDISITKADVNGRTFWRVAVSGYDAAGANSRCSSVKRSGGACFAYAAGAAPTGQALALTGARQFKVNDVKLAMNRKR